MCESNPIGACVRSDRPYKPIRFAYTRSQANGAMQPLATREAVMPKIMQRRIVTGTVLVAAIAGLGIGQAVLENKAEAQRGNVQAPMFEVDPFWPKPFDGLLGMAIGVWADEQDHIWIIHRSSATLHNNEKGAELRSEEHTS